MIRCNFARTLPALVLFSFISAVPAFAQGQAQTPPAAGPAGSTGGNTGTGGGTTSPGGSQGRPGTTPFPGSQTDRSTPFPEMQRTFFFSGKVMLDDGTPPPEPVVIERVCGGIPKPEAYTDTKGRFSFQLGQNNNMMADASTSSQDGMFGSSIPGRSGMPGGMGRQPTERDLMGCELRASLPGFRSDIVSLAGRRSLDNPDVGTLVLHRLAKVDGFTFSATSAFAPKDARKAFEKGRELNKKRKLENAQTELQKAVTEYPKYAAAWYELGTVFQQQSKIPEARNAYEEATKADAKFITPYAMLARLSAAEGKWDDTVTWSDKVIRLNPFFSPEVYFLNGVANLNTQKLEKAEESAREALRMDTAHKFPRTMSLMGVILAQKQDYKGAAENFRSYLKLAPSATDADKIREQLSEIEKQMAARENAPGQTPQ